MNLTHRRIGISSATVLLTVMAHCGDKPYATRAPDSGSFPFIERITPSVIPNNVAVELTVLGARFYPGARVWIGGVECVGTVDSYQQITCRFPGKPKTCGRQSLSISSGGLGRSWDPNTWSGLTLGSSAFGFNAATEFAVGAQPVSVVVSPFGAFDSIAVANQGSNNVSLLVGNGTGSFAPAVNFPTGSQPVSITSIAPPNYPSYLFTANQGSGNVSQLEIGVSQGVGTLRSIAHFPTSAQPRSVAAVLIPGQSSSSIVTANPASNNVSLLQYNQGRFDPPTNFPVGTQPMSVAVGDFNGDMRPDLAVANQGSNNVSVLLGDSMKIFATAANFPVGTQPVSVAVGDFNGDMKLDLAVANQGSNDVSVLLGDGTGGFTAASSFPAGTQPVSVAAGYFDSNTKTDLAVVNSGNNNVSVLLGDGKGNFGAAINFPVGSQPSSLALGDFNGDGQVDLATTNTGSNSASVLLQTCE